MESAEDSSTATPADAEQQLTLSEACGQGSIPLIRPLLTEDAVNRRDQRGYLPLQWAALNGQVEAVKYLLANGAAVDATDVSGCTAMHWAMVHGSMPVVDACMRAMDSAATVGMLRDNSGYTPLHVAAQHGHTAMLYMMGMKWDIAFDVLDNDQRTPLHWAAYKGYVDTVRLLLAFDASPHLRDTSSGRTPLHWAAIRGHRDACTVLLQGGSLPVLDEPDSSGMTPVQLAAQQGHQYLAIYLAEYRARRQSGGCFAKGGRLHWLAHLQLCPLVWIYIIGLLSVFLQKVQHIPSTLHGMPLLMGWTVLVSSAVGLFFLYKTTTSDPGVIPATRRPAEAGLSDAEPREEERAGLLLKGNGSRGALDSPALWAGQWQQLCVSCRIVRPLRAKHCSDTDRCIEVYDHYCPWVGNAIGKRNLPWFLLFLWLEMYAIIVSAGLGIARIVELASDEWKVFPIVQLGWLVGFVVLDVVVGVGVAALTIAQTLQVLRNVTTNELANWHRYPHMHAEDGRFHNPFNRGWRQNCAEAFSPDAPMAPMHLAPQASARPSPREPEGGVGPGSLFTRKGYREQQLSAL